MPTPFQILADPVSLIIMAMYLLLMVWESFFPARKLPAIPFWRSKGIVAFFFSFFYRLTYRSFIRTGFHQPSLLT
jgi:hypothetical protein